MKLTFDLEGKKSVCNAYALKLVMKLKVQKASYLP